MLKTIFDPFPEMVTERLLLRQISNSDIEEVYFLRSDAGVMKYTGQQLAGSAQEILDYIAAHHALTANGEGIIWGISIKGKANLIGLISYRRFYREHFRGEVGYGLHPLFQGMGIMQEALSAVINFGFNTIGLHTIEANVDKDNAASIKLLEKNGFVKEAHYKENYFFEGKFIDSVIYSLIDNSKAIEYYATI